jgi:menaquinone-dependent protoporphyrinogen oxidase
MRILVTAASKHGATAEVADAIGSVLRRRGHEVTVSAPDLVQSLAGVDCVVLGSAVYTGGWVKEARHFVGRFRNDFTGRIVWLFSSGPVGSPAFPAHQALDLDTILEQTGARGHVIFAGKLDPAKLDFGERLAVRAVRITPGDYRDWPMIEAWASDIADLLDAPAGNGVASVRV